MNYDELVFTDSMTIKDLREMHLNVHLVDHNVYDNSTLNLKSYELASIIDHHEDEQGLCKGLRKIEMVGSCATLITSLFKERSLTENPLSCLKKEIRILLSAAILIDTINLNFEKGRTTNLDVEMFDFLSIEKDFMDRDIFYQKLVTAKTDISKLTVYDLLRRDCKSFPSIKGQVFISSVTGATWKEFFTRKGVLEDVEKFVSENKINMLIIMLASHLEDGTFQRYLAIASGGHLLQSECINDLVNKLNLVKICADGFNTWLVYEQLHVKSSRKIVLPLLKSWLT